MSRLEIALLGSPLILADGKTIKTDRRKAIALLAYLAVSAKSHTRDHLAALLWPDYEKDSAYAYLRRTLWELNQALGKGWIVLEGDQIALQQSANVSLDTTAFEQLTRSTSTSALIQAVDLYRGDFLEGFTVADTAPFEGWQFQQVEYFRLEFSRALEKLVNALHLAQDYTAALPYARRWLTQDPLHEPANRAVMRLLACLDDRSGAVRQYETSAQLLKTELGVSPQPETVALYQEILHGDLRPGPSEQAGPTAVEMRQSINRLPVLPTPFIGRRPEVEQIISLLTSPEHRLVTLIGPGGTGKTRLSIQAASEVQEAFPDGVFFAPLASVQSAEAVLPAIAKALDFSFYQDESPRHQLLDFLREKRLLLVLDNFEHLLESSGLLSEILANAPAVTLLITSRVRLNLQGEQLYPVSGMRLPDLAEVSAWQDPETQSRPYSAIQLFLDRARRVAPGLKLTQENGKDILAVCRLVQGMPLGLELAAAWMELLSPAEIALEIARSLDFLETDQGDIPDRQRSIRAVFESSWKFLAEAEKDALQRLSVFVGRFSRDAAQEVSGAPLRILLALVNKSWLQQIGDGRFLMHELLRHYVLENLKSDAGAWQEAHNRHAAYFTGFVTLQSEKMKGSAQVEGVRAFAEEIASNIKAAWDWLVSQGRWAEIMDPYAIGLLQFGLVHGFMEEILPWVTAARQRLSAPANDLEMLAFAVTSAMEVFMEEEESIKDYQPAERIVATWQYVHAHRLAEPMGLWYILLASLVKARNLDQDAASLLSQAVERLHKQGDTWEYGIALLSHSSTWDTYRYDEEKLLMAAAIFENLGVWFERGVTANLLCKNAIHQKRPLSVVMFYDQQANACFKKFRPEPRSLGSLLNICALYFREGMIEQGFAVFRELHEFLVKVGNQRQIAINANWESLHAARYSTFEHALRTRLLSLELVKAHGLKTDYFWHLFELADIYRIFGETQKVLPLLEEAQAGFRKLYLVLGVGFCQRAYGDLALQAGQYASALEYYQQFLDYAALDNHSWSMTQAHARRGLAFAFLEDRDAARRDLKSVLAEIQQSGEDELAYLALLIEPVCLIQEHHFERAIELCAFLSAHPAAWNEVKSQAQAIQETAASHLPAEVVQAAVQRSKLLHKDQLFKSIVE